MEKLLEDAWLKLSVVACDMFGVSGRAMPAALIAGEGDPKVLAELARSLGHRVVTPGLERLPLKAPRSTPGMLQVSHGDDESPSRVTGRDMTDGVGCATQRVGAADDRSDLSGLD